MKPIPPEILAMYPSHPDAPIPGRPWWGRAGLNALAWRDGVGVVHGADQAEAMDAAHPITHPGIRVGQVWAWIRGVMVESAQVRLIRWDRHPATGARELRAVTEIGEICSTGVMMANAEIPAWLLADPCCPWLAPWGPA